MKSDKIQPWNWQKDDKIETGGEKKREKERKKERFHIAFKRLYRNESTFKRYHCFIPWEAKA